MLKGYAVKFGLREEEVLDDLFLSLSSNKEASSIKRN